MKILYPLTDEEREELRLLAENLLFDYTDEEELPREKVQRLAHLTARSFLRPGETR